MDCFLIAHISFSMLHTCFRHRICNYIIVPVGFGWSRSGFYHSALQNGKFRLSVTVTHGLSDITDDPKLFASPLGLTVFHCIYLLNENNDPMAR